ncbi:MAG: winged helix-turn-helix domain-containing protein [Acholeplasma sp.]|nr:winged helix-turn-helix domain-containing protein [Acholeplasma sp.]
MANILLISEKTKHFTDLNSELQKYGFKVVSKRYNIFDQQKSNGFIYDFVLYELTGDFHEDLFRIQLLERNGTVPVYIFGRHITEQEAFMYHEKGANGVIRIPFSPSVVAIRIISIIKLLEKTSRVINKVYVGPLEIDLHNSVVLRDNAEIKLTNAESKILRVLIKNANTVVDKDSVIRYAWDETDSATDNALGIHIARLRQKIEYNENEPVIETIWGIGYRFNRPIED